MMRYPTPEEEQAVHALRPAPSLVHTWMLQRVRPRLHLQGGEVSALLMEYLLGNELYKEHLASVDGTSYKGSDKVPAVLPIGFQYREDSA